MQHQEPFQITDVHTIFSSFVFSLMFVDFVMDPLQMSGRRVDELVAAFAVFGDRLTDVGSQLQTLSRTHYISVL
jgi:hypothetical protein